MPKRFPIRLPNFEQRVKILSLVGRVSGTRYLAHEQMLAHTKLSDSFSIQALARRTDGLSGSDLRETCRNAAMVPVREVMREKGQAGTAGLEAARKEVSYLIQSVN